VNGSVNPLRDKEIIDTELQLKDLETIEKAITKVQRAAKSGDKEAQRTLEIAEALKSHLEKGINARAFKVEKEDLKLVNDFQLLTHKPVLYVLNVDEKSVVNGNEFVDKVKSIIEAEDAEYLMVSAAIEADIAQLDSFDDRKAFLDDLGLKESGVVRLIHHAYHLLNLITYFTAGVKEVRAWTIHKGDTAPQAAGVIHTDFEKGFIRAEVISYKDFTTLGSEKACRETGKLRVEGKEYIVHDGDVMHFLFNV
jgi:ribosome-binding ATPase